MKTFKSSVVTYHHVVAGAAPAASRMKLRVVVVC